MMRHARRTAYEPESGCARIWAKLGRNAPLQAWPDGLPPCLGGAPVWAVPARLLAWLVSVPQSFLLSLSSRQRNGRRVLLIAMPAQPVPAPSQGRVRRRPTSRSLLAASTVPALLLLTFACEPPGPEDLAPDTTESGLPAVDAHFDASRFPVDSAGSDESFDAAVDERPPHEGGDSGGTPSADAALPDDATPDALDGGRGPDAADGMIAPPPTPSPANIGWIGGHCDDRADCGDVNDAICLGGVFPHGMCSRECTQLCPDRHGPMDTTTYCVDGKAYGHLLGLCVSRCDRALFAETGCPEGYRCEARNRFGDVYQSEEVCVPSVPRDCADQDDLLVAIDYPDRGALWIPGEARCGGEFDLVVMLHGSNGAHLEAGSLGGGRRVEYLVRSLIDGDLIEPIILAEPVHFEARSSVLYGESFDFEAHLQRLRPHLEAHEINLGSISYVGHSGAGCSPLSGLFKLLTILDRIVPRWAPRLKLWGLQDICYNRIDQWQERLRPALESDAAIVSVKTTGGDPGAFEQAIIGAPAVEPFTCHPDLMLRCAAHAARPYCSYETTFAAGITHRTNPYYFVREIFPQVFAADAQPCR